MAVILNNDVPTELVEEANVEYENYIVNVPEAERLPFEKYVLCLLENL